MMPREQCQLKMKMKTTMTAASTMTRAAKSREHARRKHTLLSLQLLGLILITRVDPLGCLADDISEADRPIPIVTVEGVLGNQGKLPCDIRVPTRDDKVHMVLWFRDNGDPIYRFDVRDKPSTDAKRWSDMGERVYFQAMSEPAHLLISDLKQHDGGVYRCRVDFKNSPTRNSRINLTIIVPPMKPVIYDANGIASTVIGPYNEGSELLLTCEVVGGSPKPKVTWWLENGMIDGHWVDRTDGVIVNHLNHKPLQRHHLNAQFVCQASNTNKTVPQSSMVVLNLNLRPLTVSITTKDANLLAEKRYDIECISTGSRPPATISWWKTSRQIKKTPHNPNTDDKNVTRSILSLIPTIDDDGKILTCRSENLWIPNSAMEDRWRLNVHYAPRVTMQLGSNLVADDIKEGDDVYFECSVKSNPPYKKLTWFHEGRELRHNASQRVIMSNTRLVLQKITRHSAGRYTCNALNNEGLSQSNAVHLRVKFVPTCKSKSEELIGAMRHETVTIRCEMLSDPPSVHFHWTFNSSGIEVTPISHSRFSSNGTVSLFDYTPASEMDFGTLTCWGENLIGHGTKEPCHFQIVQAGRPFPPRNCSIYNQTEDSLGILCLEGFNGGLPQHFVIEVVDTQTKKIIRSSSSKMPLFTVEGMEPSIPFKFTIFAVNAKGKSEDVIIDGITFRGVAKYTGSTTTAEMNPVYAILVGCSVVLIIFLIVTIIAIWKRSRRKKPPIAKSHLQHNHNRADTSSNNSDEAFQSTDATLTKIDQNNVGSLEDVGNPDVIPNKNGKKGGGGLRGFIRIHKTPPARRRKKEVEVKNNGETVPLTETQEVQLHQNHNHTNHSSGSNNVAGRFGGVLVLPTNSNSSSSLPRESRI